MLLCLDIGNTHILGGVFDPSLVGIKKNSNPIVRFRYATHLIGTADQFGIFLINILKFNHIDPKTISAVAMCSVVPGYDYTLQHAITQYLTTNLFILQAGVKTGLNIKYKNPNEVGADRIANAIGAVEAHPQKNIIIIDLGTATTVCAVNKKRDYLGGTILPGIRLGMKSLKNNAAKLMEVSIVVPSTYLGRTTKESLQSGLFYSQFGAIKEVVTGIQNEVFPDNNAIVIGTGGFSQLFKDKNIFHVTLPDLVLQGLMRAYYYSIEEIRK